MKRISKQCCCPYKGRRKHLWVLVSIKTLPPSSLEATEDSLLNSIEVPWDAEGEFMELGSQLPCYPRFLLPFLANEWLPMQAIWFRARFDLHTVKKVVVESYWSLQFFSSHGASSLHLGGFMMPPSSNWLPWIAFLLFRSLFLIIEIHKS